MSQVGLEGPMDNGFFTHVLLWVVLGLTALGAVGFVTACFSLGRQGSRKD